MKINWKPRYPNGFTIKVGPGTIIAVSSPTSLNLVWSKLSPLVGDTRNIDSTYAFSGLGIRYIAIVGDKLMVFDNIASSTQFIQGSSFKELSEGLVLRPDVKLVYEN